MSKFRLTRKKALEITYKMWDHLAKNPRDDKWAAMNRITRMKLRHVCACCEYVVRKHDPADQNGYMLCAVVNDKSSNKAPGWLASCPLNKLWPAGCEQRGSPFKQWTTLTKLNMTRGNLLKRAKLAGIIANAARKELNNL